MQQAILLPTGHKLKVLYTLLQGQPAAVAPAAKQGVLLKFCAVHLRITLHLLYFRSLNPRQCHLG